MEREKVAGMSVAVTDRGKIIYEKGFGAESVERPEVAPSGHSMYRIASISKLVTGITLLRLVEEGKLALDRPVRDYVPWLTLTSKEALEQMTLRHLMSHTAGLPTEYTPDGPREESALEGFLRDNLPNLEFATLPSEGVHHYSNWGIHLASYMAERVTGKRFTELCREYALAPLGMDHTTYDLRVAATYPVSVPHEAGEDGALHVCHYIKENAARMAAGGLYSCTEDLCKLARFFLNRRTDAGERLLSDASLDEMFRPHAHIAPDSPDAYGLTMRLHFYRGRVLRGHLGSAPPYASGLWTDPQSGYGVVILMNTQGDALRYAVPEMLLDDLVGEPER